MNMKMNVAEIFESIHGECNGHHQGRLVTFIRLSGCNLKCSYCDTPETQDFGFGKEMLIIDIVKAVRDLGNEYICITGGEPLVRDYVDFLLHQLWEEGFHISLETNGTIDISPYFRYVESFIVDFKFEYSNRMIRSNYEKLRSTDVIKFVVKEQDFFTAIGVKMGIEEAGTNVIFAFSPVSDSLDAADLANLLITNQVRNAVLSLQIHKMLDLK